MLPMLNLFYHKKITGVGNKMLKLIDRILRQFRICFKREEAFSWFVIIVVGIMVRADMRGVSSIVGCLGLDPSYYESMVHYKSHKQVCRR
jgi:hypothetical protein